MNIILLDSVYFFFIWKVNEIQPRLITFPFNIFEKIISPSYVYIISNQIKLNQVEISHN
jgi:hypothetical protein